jgi:hypothetical protein
MAAPMQTGRRTGARLLAAATTSYTANCALGTGVALGVIDTSNVRWVHHVLYICTSVLTGVALAALARERNRAGLLLAPAAIPLALLPRWGGRVRRHPLIALAAAPFYSAGLLKAWR